VSYIICIASRIHNRNFGSVYGNLSKPPPFYLGKMGGNIINGIAIAVLIVYLVAATFPAAPNPTPTTMNWSSLALGGTVIVAGLAYIRLRKNYLSRLRPVTEAEEVSGYVDIYVDKNIDRY
jgi:hypothetical protein